MKSSKPRTVGAWVVSHTAKLKTVHVPGQFDTLSWAGQFGILLSVLSASEVQTLPVAKLQALAKANGINQHSDLPGLLQTMIARHLIAPGDNEDVHILGLTHGSVLEKTAQFFEELGPDPEERAAIAVAEAVSEAPIRTAALSELVSDEFKLTNAQTSDFLTRAEQIGFVDAEDLDRTNRDKLYFNGNIFRVNDAQKTMRVLQSLTGPEQSKVREFDEIVATRGFATVDEGRAVLSEKLFEKLQAIALFDVNRVANDHEEVLYVTRPAAFAKYGNPWEEDTLDYAKALVSSLAYGMTRRERGAARIEVLERLLRKLIDGAWLSANSAAGVDYRYLELKNVVQTKPHPEWSGYHELRLLKREVGIVALEVLTQGRGSSEGVLEKLPESPVTSYLGPEANRVKVRKKTSVEVSDRKLADMLTSIRTGKV